MQDKVEKNLILKVNNLTCYFNYKLPNEIKALDDLSYNFEDNKIYFIIGNSGSGKSTLVYHFNGLLKSKIGDLVVDDFKILGKKRKIKNPKNLRRKISMVFQFPEYQLFKDTIIEDVSFGPRILKIHKKLSYEINKKTLVDYFQKNPNLLIDFFKKKKIYFELSNFNEFLDKIDFNFKNKYIKNNEIEKNYFNPRIPLASKFFVIYAGKKHLFKLVDRNIKLFSEAEMSFINSKKFLNLMGIDDSYFSRSPFGLSGGQKRRTAIAGILSIDPKILVFDEPTAGLDPSGEKEMMKIILDAKVSKKTVIVISHSMDHVLEVADEIIFMDKGKIILSGSPFEIFLNKDLYKKYNMEMPKIIKFILELISYNNAYKFLLETKPRNIFQLSNDITNFLEQKRGKINEL